VHRDYHSRNLMLVDGDAPSASAGFPANPGILDFQDAVYGPSPTTSSRSIATPTSSWPEDQELDS
jgi:aminoglycoside/choline kinase family phosphotransferase